MMKKTCNIDGRICWAGNTNIHIISSPLATFCIDFCDFQGINIENWQPTREKSCLDHVLNLRTSIHSIKTLPSLKSDHTMILFTIGKNSSPEYVFQRVQMIFDLVLSKWISTRLSFLSIESDLSRFTNEIETISDMTFVMIRKSRKVIAKAGFITREFIELEPLFVKLSHLT